MVHLFNDETRWLDTRGGRGLLDGPTNGDWGGKCRSGGQYSCGEAGIGDAPPTDSGDEAYKRHDHCMGEFGCNQLLVDELENLPHDVKLWPNPPKVGTELDTGLYRDRAIWWFRANEPNYEINYLSP